MPVAYYSMASTVPRRVKHSKISELQGHLFEKHGESHAIQVPLALLAHNRPSKLVSRTQMVCELCWNRCI